MNSGLRLRRGTRGIPNWRSLNWDSLNYDSLGRDSLSRLPDQGSWTILSLIRSRVSTTRLVQNLGLLQQSNHQIAHAHTHPGRVYPESLGKSNHVDRI